ncbi:hypothetical protein KFU94_68940 [Chloroflexi bacterium TSY]|nr:hypothetical protein [Chloroflexi bacterium TSY]
MIQSKLNFLGRLEINIGATLVTNFRSDKVRALLAYLAIEPQQHTRRELAALLWPDISDKHARTNLRNTIHRLRQSLDEVASDISNQLLSVTRQTMPI